MEILLDIVFLILALFVLYVLYRFAIDFKKNSTEDLKKRKFNSVEEFSDIYFNNSIDNSIQSEEIAEFKNFEFCKKCQEERMKWRFSKTDPLKPKVNENITVVYFITDNNSWQNLCGREGYKFNCSKHNLEVHEIITCMN